MKSEERVCSLGRLLPVAISYADLSCAHTRTHTHTLTKAKVRQPKQVALVFSLCGALLSRLVGISLSSAHAMPWLSHSLSVCLSLPTSWAKRSTGRRLRRFVRLVLQRNSSFFDVCSCCTLTHTHKRARARTQTRTDTTVVGRRATTKQQQQRQQTSHKNCTFFCCC